MSTDSDKESTDGKVEVIDIEDEIPKNASKRNRIADVNVQVAFSSEPPFRVAQRVAETS